MTENSEILTQLENCTFSKKSKGFDNENGLSFKKMTRLKIFNSTGHVKPEIKLIIPSKIMFIC